MPRIDEMPEYRAKLPRSTHDLSHSFGFTATCAHLLPVFHTLIDAGDTIQLKYDFNLRTQPLLAAAMEDIDVHTEYFFVPMFLLYQPFGSIYYGINDEFSSNIDDADLAADGVNFPVWDFSDYLSDLRGTGTVRQYAQNGVVIGETTNQMAYRLLDHFGFNVANNMFNSSAGNAGMNPNVFPYQFLAYHCIYQYYYRLDTREKFSNYLFNWDKFVGSASTPVSHLQYATELLFRLHYRPIASDYFSDVKVSPIVDVLNLSDKQLLPVVNQWLSRSSLTNSSSLSVPVIGSGSVGVNNGTTNGNTSPNDPYLLPNQLVQTNFGFNRSVVSVSNNTIANGLDINTANIRAIFANEKLWSVTGRAKKHYDDQTFAHFGFKVPHDVKHEISVFGHDVSQIHIGEVISTAQTDQADLGSIAGKGYARSNSKVHTFKAPCHGVVMVLFSITPRYKYYQTIGKYNVLANRFDLPIPEYDHLGMQPLFGYEVVPDSSNPWTDIYGWQYRYEQFKRRYNRVSQAFGSGSLSSWMLGFRPYRTGQLNSANTSSYIDFIYRPTDLNQLFLLGYKLDWDVAWNTSANRIYDNDPFIVDSYVSAKLNSWMSDYSLPRLDA